MKPNCEEMDWEEVANLLNGANNILAENLNDLTEENSHLLMQIVRNGASQLNNTKGENSV